VHHFDRVGPVHFFFCKRAWQSALSQVVVTVALSTSSSSSSVITIGIRCLWCLGDTLGVDLLPVPVYVIVLAYFLAPPCVGVSRGCGTFPSTCKLLDDGVSAVTVVVLLAFFFAPARVSVFSEF